MSIPRKTATSICGVIFAVSLPFATASPAAASSTATATQAGQHDASAICYVKPRPNVRAVIVESKPRVNSSNLGQINRGTRAKAVCQPTKGGWYRASGCKESNWWIKVNWHGQRGWVPWGCVTWWKA